MKAFLSSIAIGVCFAYAADPASAQSTVMVTQQGYGNDAYAEQASVSAATSAAITQVGNDNRVGGAGGASGGIVQRDAHYRISAVVDQNGAGNSAGITQDQVSGLIAPVEARITQRGVGNGATILQNITSASHAVVDQNGSGNLATLEQIRSADAGLLVTQNGADNKAAVTQIGGGHGGPMVDQSGEGNTASVVVQNIDGFGASVTQNGIANKASARLTDTDSTLTILQQGTGNIAEGTQAGGTHDARIEQNGNDNFANVIQSLGSLSALGNRALITQVGNDNGATVRQFGQGYVATVNQVGSGNQANVYQH